MEQNGRNWSPFSTKATRTNGEFVPYGTHARDIGNCANRNSWRFGTIPNFFGVTWPYGTRELPKMENSEWSNATMHRSVYERFDMDEVPDYDLMTEYRPITLANHLDFKDAYGNPGSKSDPKRIAVAAYTEERLPSTL
jgi:hypothetical protein